MKDMKDQGFSESPGPSLLHLSLILTACLTARPQAVPTRQQPQPPVFRSAVDVAVVDVTVVDDDGKPVRGLTAGDFVVTVAGQRRRIQALDFLEFGAQRHGSRVAGPAGSAVSTGLEKPVAPGLNRGGRIIVVAVDDLSSRPAANAGLLAAAERILATLDPTDLVGLVTTSGFGPVVSPTTNRDEFRSALRNKTIVGRNDSISAPFYITTKEGIDADNRIRGLAGWLGRECPPPPEPTDPSCTDRAMSAARRIGAEARHRRDQQLGAYAAIIEGLKSMPRPRVLIVLGQGLALDGYSDRRQEIDRLGRLAADADVRFYSVTDTDDGPGASMRGSAAKCDPPCINYYRAQVNEQTFLLGGMQILAEATGGEAFRNIGQADRFLDRVITETSGLYRLGVEIPAGAADKYPILKVTTTRRGLTIRATRHLAPERDDKRGVAVEALLRQRIATGGQAFGVPLTVAALMRGNPALPQHDAGISVRVPGDVQAPLILLFALVDDAGTVPPGGSGRRDIAPHTAGDDHEVTFLVPVPANAKGYRLRVAVADAQGRVGGIERHVMNTVVAAGPVTMSPVFLSWSTTDDRRYLAFDVAPRAASALSCTIDVYAGATTPPDLSVRSFFYRNGSTTSELEREVVLSPTGAVLTGTVTVPIAELPSGDYVVTATVMSEGRPLGSQSAAFSIRPR